MDTPSKLDNLFVNLKKGKKTKTGRKGWGLCVQWNLLIVDTLGTSILCIVQRLSLLHR